MSLKVAVAGATGFIGRNVCRRLIDAGHEVRGLVRDVERARQVLPSAVELVEAKRISPEACARLTESCDAGVYAIGIIREAGPGQRFKLLHVEGVRWFTEALRAAGGTRIVHVSALGADPEGRAEYQKTKARGERVVRSSGLDWTIFRPSLVHGAEGEFTQMATDWARGRIPPFFVMPYFQRRADGQWNLIPGELKDPTVAPIFVDDLTRAITSSLSDDDTIGELYNAVGPEQLSWPDLLTTVRDNVRRSKPTINPGPVPAPPAAAFAQTLELVGLGQFLPFDSGMASMGSEDSVSRRDKWTSAFGDSDKGFTEALRTYAGAV